MAANQKQVHFLAVARLKDRVLVGAFQNSPTDLSAVKQMIGAPEFANMTDNQLYAFAKGTVAWHLVASKGVLYILTTAHDYPSRVASACLKELERTFAAKCAGKWETAKEGQLDAPCKSLFNKIADKYDDLNSVSKMHETMAKVDAVKVTMQKNIEAALENSVKLDNIEVQAEDLRMQATIFKTNANDLKNKMWWKNLKMKLLIAGLAILIIGIIIIVILSQTGAFNSNDD